MGLSPTDKNWGEESEEVRRRVNSGESVEEIVKRQSGQVSVQRRECRGESQQESVMNCEESGEWRY